MPTHNGKDGHHGADGPSEIDASQGYEQTDVGVTGIIWFLGSLAFFVAVTGVFCFFLGKGFNRILDREDGPNSKWTQTVDIRQLGNLPTNPELQNKIAELTKSFPTPRVQLDDGNEDVSELHAREDLLLDNYTWVDQSKGKVRIPIERAMELIAQRGLPVAAAAEQAPLMTADKAPVVTEPLTDGFARTAYEQEQRRIAAERSAQPETK
jgi:hypothetical protein